MKSFLLTLLCFFGLLPLFAQNDDFRTFTYYQDDTVALKLDLFLPDTAGKAPVPLLIFVHGGGFSGGNRRGGHKLARFLAPEGFAVASITYSLYMKGRSFSCEGFLPEKVKAIQVAANQLWLATNYLRGIGPQLGIDSSAVFIAGSSAGAETVLHAAFWDRQVMDLYGEPLPASFRYAGVISGAGALMDLNLITEENHLPVLLFHGTEDPLVPYATAAHHFCPPNAPGWLMLFGSHSIFEHLRGLHEQVRLLTYCGGGHEYAGHHFSQKQGPVLEFLQAVLAGEKEQRHQVFSSEKGKGTQPFCQD
jgi:pimeloyl-ACP methyl ester carboxylesterase